MNSILGNSSVMLQAVSAMARGENPRTFLQNLAQSNPKLQGLDFSNLQGLAKSLCDKNGLDMNKLANEVTEFANSHR